ncbi:MAG: FecR domain-containing protein, partial [Deltaproteobacteria bacterium]|nr:FecR domain-containing protein [Deltaproteobacteria bacterium]
LPARRWLRRPAPAEALSSVAPGAGARWSRRVTGAQETVVLQEGTLTVSVPHQHAGHRFVVLLPDGTLEVRGTAFTVRARGGETTDVQVREGVVWLDLRGAEPRTLTAGQRWTRAEAPAEVARVASAPTPSAPPEVGPPRSAEAPRPSQLPAPSPRAPRPRPAFRDYADGVGALARGDYRAAAEALQRFERAAPHDQRAEDAAWLRVVALRRAGDRAGARGATEHYLRAFPQGAHRDAARRALGE